MQKSTKNLPVGETYDIAKKVIDSKDIFMNQEEPQKKSPPKISHMFTTGFMYLIRIKSFHCRYFTKNDTISTKIIPTQLHQKKWHT